MIRIPSARPGAKLGQRRLTQPWRATSQALAKKIRTAESASSGSPPTYSIVKPVNPTGSGLGANSMKL